MSTLSELIPSGGTGKVMDFVASGSLPSGKTVVLKADGKVELVTASNLTTGNFVGITTETISDTATGSVTLQGGLSTNQAGLTIGSTYYVQTNGTLATTAGVPSVIAGLAISATSLQLQGV